MVLATKLKLKSHLLLKLKSKFPTISQKRQRIIRYVVFFCVLTIVKCTYGFDTSDRKKMIKFYVGKWQLIETLIILQDLRIPLDKGLGG